MKKRIFFLTALISTWVVGVTVLATVPSGFQESILADSLQQPVGLAFAPDGRLFIIEQRTGNIQIFKDDAVLPDPFVTVSPVFTGHNESGLIGIAIDPDFAQNNFVYVFVTRSSSIQCILRYTAVGDTGTEETVIVDNLPHTRCQS